MRNLRDRLQDVLDAIAQIEVEQKQGKEAFENSPLIQVWMVHDYFRINRGVVWETVVKDLPALKEEVGRILSQLPVV